MPAKRSKNSPQPNLRWAAPDDTISHVETAEDVTVYLHYDGADEPKLKVGRWKPYWSKYAQEREIRVADSRGTTVVIKQTREIGAAGRKP